MRRLICRFPSAFTEVVVKPAKLRFYQTMNYAIRAATKFDEPFLWQNAHYAAHMDEDDAAAESARTNPDLAGYVEGWGNGMETPASSPSPGMAGPRELPGYA